MRQRAPPTSIQLVDDAIIDAFASLYWDENKGQSFFQNSFLGIPAIQHPFDAWVTLEIIHETAPELIVECGSFYGGSAVMWASHMLHTTPDAQVIAIDVDDQMDIARRNRIFAEHVTFLHGSSIDPNIVAQVHDIAAGRRTMVILDSLHTCDHVTAELDAYAGLVSPGCYLIVQDGFVNGHPLEPDWGPGPFEATEQFLSTDDRFEQDRTRERMFFTFNPGGFLRRNG